MLVIPSFPSIKIDNFLCKIDENIKIIGLNKVINKQRRKFKTNYITISKILDYNNSSCRHFLQNKKYPPIQFLKKLNNFDKRLLNLIYNMNTTFSARTDEVRLPKILNPKLAYFIGYLQGDGFLGSDRNTYGFSDENKEHLLYINELNYELFGKKGRVRFNYTKLSKTPVPYLEIRQYVINSYLHNVWGIPKGFKQDLYVPDIMYKNKKIMKWYIKGLFDADGTLPKNPAKAKQYFIDLNMRDQKFIEEINNILENIFYINTLKIYKRVAKSPCSNNISITWEIRIRKHSEIRKFLKEIGFYHIDKQKRMEKLIKLLPG